MERSHYGLYWDGDGAIATPDGQLYAMVYVFGSRRSRDHWVADGIDQPGYRWPASRRQAQRATGWDDRGPYTTECGLCGRVFRDDCDRYEHHRLCVDNIR